MKPATSKFREQFAAIRLSSPQDQAPTELANLAQAVAQEHIGTVQDVQAGMRLGFTSTVQGMLGRCCARVNARLHRHPEGGVSHEEFVAKMVGELIEHSSLGIRLAELEARTPFASQPLLVGQCPAILEWAEAVESAVKDWETSKTKLPKTNRNNE